MPNMLKVLLADDEPVIVRGLAKLIPWDKYGLSIVGEAGTGEELLQAILDHAPDIVISDIAMPGLSGIDVLKKLKELGKPTKVIFISAYQEFAYARDAVSYGAVDYLVKPIDRIKLEEVLRGTAELIRKTTEQQTKQSRLLAYEKQLKSREIEELFDRLTDGERIAPEVADELRESEAKARFSVVAVTQDAFHSHPGSWGEGEWKLLQFSLHNVMEEVVRSFCQGWVFAKQERLVAVLKHPEAVRAEEVAAHIHSSITGYLKASATVGVGLPGPLEDVAESYRQALAALKIKFFAGTNRTFMYSALPPAPAYDGAAVETLEKELAEALIAAQGDTLYELLDELLASIRSAAWGNREYAVNLGYAAVLALYREIAAAGMPVAMNADAQRRLGERLNGCETFAEVGQIMKEELFAAETAVKGHAGSKERKQILQVKSYIEEHYAEEINLERIAAFVFMNPNYFSSLFKKHTGQNFKQYLTEVRMKHALRLLQQSDLMVYEVAEQVGYNNARQFSDMFKKRFGKLPNEYR
jgi:two-component system response regulator YesN